MAQIMKRFACSTASKKSIFNIARVMISSGGGQEGFAKGLVLGVYEKEGDKDPKLTHSAEMFDLDNSGIITDIIREASITGSLGRGKLITHIRTEDYDVISLIGLGRKDADFNAIEMVDEGLENVRIAAGAGAKSLQEAGCAEIAIDSMDFPEQAAEGAALAVYRIQDDRKNEDRIQIPKLELFDCTELEAWTRGLYKAEAQNLARRLSEASSNPMTPDVFAQATFEALSPGGVKVEIRTMEWIEQQRLNSFLMAVKGSSVPPVLLEIRYNGATPRDRPILLLGKGITFKSGCIDLQTAKGKEEYRTAIAGAAISVAAVRAAAALSLPLNIAAIIPLWECLPPGISPKTVDSMTLLNGRTVVIRDFDKAGVITLADPMIYAHATYDPSIIVDIASLGTDVVEAFGGDDATGIFCNARFIWQEFQLAGSMTGDPVRRLPMWPYYKSPTTKDRTLEIVDSGEEGPSSSGLAISVLHEVVPYANWAHLDVHGVKTVTLPTRTLVQFLCQMANSFRPKF